MRVFMWEIGITLIVFNILGEVNLLAGLLSHSSSPPLESDLRMYMGSVFLKSKTQRLSCLSQGECNPLTPYCLLFNKTKGS